MIGKNLGISDTDLAASVRVLNDVLANECIILVKSTKARWNIRGTPFHALHELWKQQSLQLARIIDEAGERVRALGLFPLGTVAEMLRNSTLTEDAAPFSDARQAVESLCGDHESMCRVLRKAIHSLQAGDSGDVGTVDLLTRALQLHERAASTLGAFIEGTVITGGNGGRL